MLAIIGVALMGGTTFFVGYQLFSGQVESIIAQRLTERKPKSSSVILRLCRPWFTMLVLPYAMKIEAPDWRKRQKRYLISAGLDEELDTDELLAFKIFLGAIVPLLLICYQMAMSSLWPWWIYPAMMMGLFIYPSAWVKGRRKLRHEEIRLQLPFVIDLLTLSTEAGLDFIGALQKVVEKTRSGPLVNEIERMIQEIQLGTTRAESLRNLGYRIDLQEVSSLVAVLVTADQMGSPLGSVLRVQADLIRNKRFTDAEKKGAAASQKILFPLIFFIMPAVFIMIFGPVVLSMFGLK